jgi:dTDP-4-amino-4,6-dideoxygalactose transaminase
VQGSATVGHIAAAFPRADAIMNTAIFLGTYPGLTQEMLNYEIQVIREFVSLMNPVD